MRSLNGALVTGAATLSGAVLDALVSCSGTCSVLAQAAVQVMGSRSIRSVRSSLQEQLR